jgi:tripartite ATP-independent transporter DctP family solute receptor
MFTSSNGLSCTQDLNLQAITARIDPREEPRVTVTGFKTSFATACAGVAFFAAGALHAQTQISWAHVYEAQEPYHIWAEWVAEQFAERTEGRYEIVVHPASTLGSQVALAEGLDLGTIDMMYDGQFFAGTRYGPMALGSAPFVFGDYAHWERYRESDLFEDLAQGYRDATGDDVLALVYYGQRHMTSNQPITSPEDMEGMQVRVPNASLYTMFPRAVGANPTPMAFSEVYLGLQQGVVDAQENPLPTIQAQRFHEVQSHITLTGHITDALLTIVAAHTREMMSEEDYAILTELVQEGALRASDDIRQSELDLVEWFRDEGITVTEIDTAPFAEAVAPMLADEASWDEETYERLQALR